MSKNFQLVQVGVSQNYVYYFGVPRIRIVFGGSILGSSYFGKLPNLPNLAMQNLCGM